MFTERCECRYLTDVTAVLISHVQHSMLNNFSTFRYYLGLFELRLGAIQPNVDRDWSTGSSKMIAKQNAYPFCRLT